MSVDSSTGRGGDVSEDIGCSLCGGRLRGDDRIVTCYPEAGRTAPSPAADDGVLALCEGCTDEVDELLDAWTGHEDPPVDAEWSIGAGYARVADDCSFCDRTLGEDSVLGVEYYRRDAAYDGGERPSANYSLCEGCGSVFEEFLDQIGSGDTV